MRNIEDISRDCSAAGAVPARNTSSRRELKLDERLMEAAWRVRQGSRLCDVGCDHGKLTAWLIEKEIVPSAIAVDISDRSLDKARALFRKRGLEQRVQTRAGDGLAPVQPHEVDDVVIAGLGYDTIVAIIDAAPWLRQPCRRLILVPSSRHERLRTWLGLQGFHIDSEKAVACSGHLYTVMTVGYSGVVRHHDPGYAAIGEVPGGGGPAARSYIEQVGVRARRVAESSRDEEQRQHARRVLMYIDRLEKKEAALWPWMP